MEVTAEAVNKLFWRLRERYGSRWVMLYKTTDEYESAKAEWLKKLKYFQIKDIAKALDHVKELYPGNPPNMAEFIALVKHLKGSRPGHLSNRLWQSQEKRKVENGTDYRKRIKEEFGV